MSSSTSTSSTCAPKLPDGMSLDGLLDAEIEKRLAEGKGWSPDEFNEYMKGVGDNHPLFAESIDDMDPEMVEMFSNMKYDGQSALDLMENCKNHGNQLFQWGNKNKFQYVNAIKSYSEALDWANKVEEAEKTEEYATKKSLG